jgi:hypothetical protein
MIFLLWSRISVDDNPVVTINHAVKHSLLRHFKKPVLPTKAKYLMQLPGTGVFLPYPRPCSALLCSGLICQLHGKSMLR